MKLLKVFSWFVALVLIIILITIAYWDYEKNIRTYGLQEKLSELEGVVSVENYHTYEGNAFFTLRLSHGKRIVLGSISNQDLISSDGIMIDQIGSHKIICKYSYGRTFGPGVNTKYIGQDHIEGEVIENVPNLIKYYDDLENLFAKMPLEFSTPPDSNDSLAISLICKDAKTAN